jgi:hypothetical protein
MMTVALVPVPPGPFPKLAQFALKCLRALILVVAALQPALAGAQPNAELEFVLFDAPGAVDTSPTSINDRGVIIGNALMGAEPGRWRVFVRRPDGSFNFLDDLEGLGTDETEGGSTLTVSASGINNRGQVVGQYFGHDFRFHGFLRRPGGELTVIDFPGVPHTVAKAINDRGQIVGNYLLELASAARSNRGFLRERDGTFIEIDFPGARWTIPEGINNAGVIVGWYQIFDDDDNFIHQAGFVRFPNGRYVEVDASLLWDINDRGDIVGAGADGEFFWPAFGSPIPLDPPGCPEPGCLRALNFGISVNNRRQIVGKLRDDTGLHGYLVRFAHRFHGRLHRH